MNPKAASAVLFVSWAILIIIAQEMIHKSITGVHPRIVRISGTIAGLILGKIGADAITKEVSRFVARGGLGIISRIPILGPLIYKGLQFILGAVG